MKYLQRIGVVGNSALRVYFKDTALYSYEERNDISYDGEIVTRIKTLSDEYFQGDARFNLPDQKTFNWQIEFIRWNENDIDYFISYEAGLGLYSDHKYKGNVDRISTKFKAPQDVIDKFIMLEKGLLND